MEAPPLVWSPEVEADLESNRTRLGPVGTDSRAGATCVVVKGRRVSDDPLRPGLFRRMIGAKPPALKLPPHVSKFGGAPYAESQEDWDGFAFLGQIDLDEATKDFPDVRLSGLLRLDRVKGASAHDCLRVQVFVDPQEEKAVDTSGVVSVGTHEASIGFETVWEASSSLEQFEQIAGQQLGSEPRSGFDQVLEVLMSLGESGVVLDPDSRWTFADRRDGGRHLLLGTEHLDEDFMWGEVPEGMEEDSSAFRPFLRLDFDPAAGFGWGSNWPAVVVPKDDVASGTLSRFGTGAAQV